MPDIESAADLYGLNPAEFTAARDQLAKALRAAGQRDEAGRIAKLRRPPASVWALNMLARHDLARLEAVFDAAEGLRAALGNDTADLRAVQAAYREAVDAAVASAAELTGVTGDDMRTRMRTNLLAAAADEEVATQLRAGTLSDDQESPGFASTPVVAPGRRLRLVPDLPPAEVPATKTEAPVEAEPEPTLDKRQQAAAAEAERKRIARERKALEQELDRQQRKARRLAEEADAASQRAVVAHQAADRALAEVDDIMAKLRDL